MSKVRIHNAENPSGIEVDMPPAQQAWHDQKCIDAEAEGIASENARVQAEADKVSGNAKLLALGLTQEEVDALVSKEIKHI